MKKSVIAVASALTAAATLQAQPRPAYVYTTDKAMDARLCITDTLLPTPARQPLETEFCVTVDPLHQFQTYQGMGGAITDAVAITLAKLPKAKQEEFMKAYYGPQGIDYTVIRTPIGSSDFGEDSYAYIREGDTNLDHFDIARDKRLRIPVIKAAMRLIGHPGKLLVAPWTPPKWWKDNQTWEKGGTLLPDYRQRWADYYVKFIQAYEKEGMPVWGLSTQNEPMAVQTWESCIYTAEEERDFIKRYLGPTLWNNGMQDKRLIIWDHNRDLVFHRASTILNDPEAAKYVYGIGFHWYETWTGSKMNFENLYRTREAFPDKELIFTEGCVEKFSKKGMKNWSLGERYGYSIIHDFNCGTSMWTDWNILLDETGGPNHVGNLCFAPVHADTRKGTLYFTNSYFYIGHFSKFIRPGARRVSAASSREELYVTAALNPNGDLAVVVMNPNKSDIVYHLLIGGDNYDVQINSHSIQTIMLKK